MTGNNATGWKALCVILLIPVMMALHGWALVYLWQWFVVPLGMHAITFWWGFGLALIVGLFRRTPHENSSDDIDKSVGRVFAEMFGNAFVFALGWAIHHWVVVGP